MSLLTLMFVSTLARAADVKVSDAEGERLYVFVNGDEKGRTPMTVKLPAGRHTISVKEVPYLAAELEVTVEVVDEAAKGALEFSWEYERASFGWNGEDMLVILGQGAGGSTASGVRAEHRSSMSVERVADPVTTTTTTTTTTSTSSSSGASSGGSSAGGSSAGGSSSGGTSTGGSSTGGSSTGGSSSGGSSSDGASSGGSSTGGSSSGSTSADGSSAGGSSAGGSSAGVSSSGGSSSGGTSGGGDAVAAIDPGAFDPKAKPVKIEVPAFDPLFKVSLRDASGLRTLDYGGGPLTLPGGPNELVVTLADEEVSVPVVLVEGATLALPWGIEVDDGEGGIQRFLYPAEGYPPEQDFRVTLPAPVDYPVAVKAYLTPTPGLLQRYEIDPMLHPAYEAWEELESTLPGKAKAGRITGALVGAGVGVMAMGAGTWWYANQVNDQAKATTDPAEYRELSDRAELLLYAGNGLGALGIAVSGSGLIYRVTGGKKYVDAYNEADAAYREAKRETVSLDSLSD